MMRLNGTRIIRHLLHPKGSICRLPLVNGTLLSVVSGSVRRRHVSTSNADNHSAEVNNDVSRYLVNPKRPRVVVGLSGGVDSSVTALLLKQQGYDCIGVHMKNWDEIDENGVCTFEAEATRVQALCQQLDIPYHPADFTLEYWHDVFETMLSDVEKGYTPNPDLSCNRSIKFGSFVNYARDRYDAEFIATGHYAQVGSIPGHNAGDGRDLALYPAVDREYDQSYFLASIDHHALKHVMFPIGHLTKASVRSLAIANGLVTAHSKNSTGICFIGKRNFGDFLDTYLPPAREGDIIEIDIGRDSSVDSSQVNVVGRHQGLRRYTIGQRARIGGRRDPLFVARKDEDKNTLFVASGRNHRSLFSNEMEIPIKDMYWLAPSLLDVDVLRKEAIRVGYRIRYSQKEYGECELKLVGDRVVATFLHPQRAVTPGQYAVFYSLDNYHDAGTPNFANTVCLGCGQIASAGTGFDQLGLALPTVYYD